MEKDFDLQQFLKDAFPLDKLRELIFDNLKEDFLQSYSNGEFVLSVVDKDEMRPDKLTTLKDTDDLNVIQYTVEYQPLSGLHYKIVVAVGTFQHHPVGFMKIGGCIFALHFNDDFSFYDYEYYYCSMLGGRDK
jgi:hypothetical protein